MPVLRMATSALKADAVLVYSWTGGDGAVVRHASAPELRRLPLTICRSRLREERGLLVHDVAHTRRVVGASVAASLPWAVERALLVESRPSDGSEPLGGFMALWADRTRIPLDVEADLPVRAAELGAMAEEWLRHASDTDRARLFEEVMRRSGDAILFIPESDDFAVLNPAAARLLGDESEMVAPARAALLLRELGARVTNVNVEEEHPQLLGRRTPDVIGATWEIETALGSRRALRVSAGTLHDDTLRGRLWTFRDVTTEHQLLADLRQREAEHAAERRFLHDVLEAIGDAIVVCDTAGAISLCNAAARALFELDALPPDAWRAAIRRGLQSVDGQPVTASTLTVLDRARAGEEVHNADVRIRTASGSERALLVSARPRYDSTGQLLDAVSVSRDVTERNRLEAHVQQTTRLEALGRMAASVTHDLNNLLTVMQATSEQLQDPALAADGPEIMADMLTAVEDARVLTRSLLDFCRGRPRQLAEVNVRTLLGRMQRLLRRMASDRVVIRAEGEGDEVMVHGDAVELEQVLLNLCGNALDAMPHGGTLSIALDLDTPVPLHLARKLTASAGAGFVHLRVADTGHGIPPEALSHIFEPFFTTKAEGSGTGLGLATVYGIVTRMGGAIEVTSALQVGTVVDIWLPSAAPARQTVEAASHPRPKAEPDRVVPAPSEVPRVLVVDDDDAVRAAVCRFVNKLGYVVAEAASGAAALEFLAGEQADVVLSDVVMPLMDGAQFVQALRARGDTHPVVFMSGYSTIDEMAMDQLGGVAGFLPKPFTVQQLDLVLQRIVARPH